MAVKEFKVKTLVLKKEAWFALRNYERMKNKYHVIPHEAMERMFNRSTMRNLGANSKTHPIADDEIRIIPSEYEMPVDEVMFFLEVLNGLAKEAGKGPVFRDDGFEQEGINL